MQVCKCRYDETMKRDMDLVRNLLLHVDNDPQFDGRVFISPDTPEEFGITGHSIEEIRYHLTMLMEEGMLAGSSGADGPMISKLTWKGHEFLDDTRDPDIWAKTQERVRGLSSVGVAIFWELAKAELKKKLGLN